MERLFKLKQNGTTIGREIIAGLTTFFAMAYIIVVNPNMLSQTGISSFLNALFQDALLLSNEIAKTFNPLSLYFS